MKNPIYKISNLKAKEGNNLILDIKKLEIHRGSCYVFYGDVGSGKTTLLNFLAKNRQNKNDVIYYESKDINKISKAEYLKETYFVPQEMKSPWFGVTVNDYLLKKLKSYKNLSNPDRKASDIIRKMNLKKYLTRNLKELSPGEKRWIELALAIAADTKVLFVDGFGQYLGDDKINSLSRILYRKINYDGVTVIIGTHIREKLSKIASVFIRLDAGRIVSVRSKKKRPYNQSNSRSYKKTKDTRKTKK